MNPQFSASAVTAGALISTTTFRIPQFQREYAWLAEDYEEFWRDLQRSLGDKSYFLGLVILTGADRDRKLVVDGQQRLLSIALVARALQLEAIRNGREGLAERLRADFIATIDLATDETAPRFELADAEDDRTFAEIMTTSGPEIREGATVAQRMLDAYRFFTTSLAADLAEDPFKRLGLWAEFLTYRLQFAVFIHPDEASAYRVFEVINTRGRELTTADLLKNYLLSQVHRSEYDRTYHRWQGISKALEPGGPNAFVQFIRHVVTLSAGYVAPKELYAYLAQRRPSNTPPPSAIGLLETLEQNLPAYLQMTDASNPGPADQAVQGVFGALNDLNVIAVRPLLLAIGRTAEPVAGAYAVLDLVVRRIVVGNLGTGNVERRLGDAAARVARDGDWGGSLHALRDLNPPREDFVAQLSRRSLNKGTLQFLRRSIVQRQKTPEPVGWIHFIRPRQAWDWPGFDEDEFTYWGSTIGNTLLASEDRRPWGTTTWHEVVAQLLPLAVEGEWAGRLAGEAQWTANSVEEIGGELAEAGADVWYAD